MLRCQDNYFHKIERSFIPILGQIFAQQDITFRYIPIYDLTMGMGQEDGYVIPKIPSKDGRH